MRKLFILMFCVIFLIGNVIALEFDNVKDYNQETKTITINNMFGLGEKIAEIELKTPLNYLVPRGYQKVAEFEVRNFEDYTNAFKELELFDKKNGDSKLVRNYDFKVLSYEDVVINDYVSQCGDVYNPLNKTDELICENVIVGNHIEQREVWSNLIDSDFMNKDNLTIGIFTNVEEGDVVEWIPNMFGVRINEWAVWTESLNTGLFWYHTFNESSGDLIDRVSGVYNGTLAGGVTQSSPGKIGTAYNFDAVNGKVTLPSQTTFWDKNFSFSLWINTSGFTGTEDVVFYTGLRNIVLRINTSNDFRFTMFDGTEHSVNIRNLILNDWVHLVITRDTFNGLTIYSNGILNETDAFVGNGATEAFSPTYGTVKDLADRWYGGSIDEVGLWNRSLTSSEVTQLYNGGTGLTYNPSPVIPELTLNSPVNNTNQITNSIVFNCSSSSGANLLNLSLIIDEVINTTIFNTTSSETNLYLQQNLTFLDGDYNWSCNSFNTLGNEGTSETRIFSIDSTIPIINTIFPTGNISYQALGENLTLNWTVSDSNIDSCWYNYDGTNTTVTCSANTTQFNVTSYTNLDLTFYANDTFGNENSNATTWHYTTFENSHIANTSTFETAQETFVINISADGDQSITANLIYNETSYTGIKTGNNTEMLFTRTIQIPTIPNLENKTFYWNISYGSTEITTFQRNQTINPITLNLCNSTLNTTYINFTFKNETISEESINATIDSSTFTYWLTTESVNKSLTFSNATENKEYSFCFSPPDKTLNTKINLDYNNGESQQRTFLSQSTLTNTTTNQTLFLLPTSDGIFVTFQVVNFAQQVLEGVNVTVTRNGDLIEQDLTDSAGSVNFFLNPDTSYTFSFDKFGLESFTTTLSPSQTSYTITLGGTTTTVPDDLTQGITYFFKPTGTVLSNGTLTSFNFTITSSFWSLEEFGFVLTNNSDILTSISSTTSTGGVVNSDINTGENITIVMEAYWIIDGNYTNVTKSWKVRSSGDNTFSILYFFTDLGLYIDSGILGLDNFGLAIITFLIIFIFTGVMSFKFGLRSPEALLGLVFSLVLFLDVGINLIPNPIGAVPHFPTILIGIILFGIYIREVNR